MPAMLRAKSPRPPSRREVLTTEASVQGRESKIRIKQAGILWVAMGEKMQGSASQVNVRIF